MTPRLKDVKLPAYDLFMKDRSADRLPANLHHICSYDLNLQGAEIILEAIFLRRLRTIDELWAVMTDSDALLEIADSDVGRLGRGNPSISAGRPLRTKRTGTPEETCRIMLDLLFRAYEGIGQSPGHFRRPGIISEEVYHRILEKIRAEIEANRIETERHQTEIIHVARELGLHPFPSGENIDLWVASCPGTQHPIYLTASENEFTCPWCRRKGGPAELRAFVAQRLPQRE
jgi:hypothetical protein